MFRDLPHLPSVCTAVVVLCVMLAALSLYVLALLFVCQFNRRGIS